MDLKRLTDEVLSSTYVIQVVYKSLEDEDLENNIPKEVEENISKGLSLINESLSTISNTAIQYNDKISISTNINIVNEEYDKELNDFIPKENKLLK